MLTRRSATQTIAWFVDLAHSSQLDLEPPYQRKSVWNLEYQQYFIDSILKNFPSPAVFLDVTITAAGRSIYHVVDGKQRLTSILDFVQDRFQTLAEGAAGRSAVYYSDLDSDTKRAFLSYIVPVEMIEGSDESELEQAFDRLNRNVAKLNAQELRHARYSGEFIRLMETLAEDPYWTDLGIATPARIRRMGDIEYVSELFILTMHGIHEGKEELDEYYAKYDDEIPDVDENRRRYEKVKSEIGRLWPHFTSDRFRNLADFYSLWTAVLDVSDADVVIDVEESAKRLSDFADSVREGANGEAQEYLVAVTQGSNKAPNRRLRANLLRKQFV
ncbi:MAG TPA: DUF262 domain-containing protein [Solirubrobacteraceae bacterium]|jgi:hypothetical protein|nr:DUF262 domain-containing protein [Solirubrobacteraceae bacterium]